MVTPRQHHTAVCQLVDATGHLCTYRTHNIYMCTHTWCAQDTHMVLQMGGWAPWTMALVAQPACGGWTVHSRSYTLHTQARATEQRAKEVKQKWQDDHTWSSKKIVNNCSSTHIKLLIVLPLLPTPCEVCTRQGETTWTHSICKLFPHYWLRVRMSGVIMGRTLVLIGWAGLQVPLQGFWVSCYLVVKVTVFPYMRGWATRGQISKRWPSLLECRDIYM